MFLCKGTMDHDVITCCLLARHFCSLTSGCFVFCVLFFFFFRGKC